MTCNWMRRKLTLAKVPRGSLIARVWRYRVVVLCDCRGRQPRGLMVVNADNGLVDQIFRLLQFSQLPSSLTGGKILGTLNLPSLATSSIFFCFLFVKKSLICLELKSMTPHRGNTILFCSSQQLPRLCLGPSKGFLS